MRYLTFTFGGVDTQIKEPTYGQAKAWRSLVEARLTEIAGLAEGDLMNILSEAAALQIPTSKEEAAENAAAGDFDRAAALLGKLSPTLGQVAKLALNSVDEAADLLFAYGPELTKRREEIEGIAYSDEIISALWVVIQSAYPFLTIKKLAMGLMDQFGQKRPPTSTNLADQNGAQDKIKA